MTDESRMVVIGCLHSAGLSRDALLGQGGALPAWVEWLDVSCGGSVDELLLLKAFASGAERVLVLVCNSGACRSLDGSRWAEKHCAAAQAWLAEIGIDAWRLQCRNIGPNMPADLLAWIEGFAPPAAASEAPAAQRQRGTER